MSSAGWEEKLSLLANHFRRHEEVVAAYLFGSVARGMDDHLSDVDLAGAGLGRVLLPGGD